MAAYTIRYELEGAFDETVEQVVDGLADEGFGVLCDVDVQATLSEKLDEEFRQYRILGACNPPLAHEGMSAELELGALLPCNVIVYETGTAQGVAESASGEQPRDDEGTIGVSAVDPSVMLSVVDNPDLDPIAEEVGERLESVLAGLPDAEPAQAAD